MLFFGASEIFLIATTVTNINESALSLFQRPKGSFQKFVSNNFYTNKFKLPPTN